MSKIQEDLYEIIKDKNIRRTREALSLLAESFLYRAHIKKDENDKIQLTKALILKILPYLMNYLSIMPNLRGKVRKEILIDSLHNTLDVYKEKLPHDTDNAIKMQSFVSSHEFSNRVDKLYKAHSSGEKFRSDIRSAYKNRKKKANELKSSLENVFDFNQMLIKHDDLTVKCTGSFHKMNPYVNRKYKKMAKWIKKMALSDLSKIRINNGVVTVENILTLRSDPVSLMSFIQESIKYKDVYNLSKDDILKKIKEKLRHKDENDIDIDEFLSVDEDTSQFKSPLKEWFDNLEEYKRIREEIIGYFDEINLDIFKGNNRSQIKEKLKNHIKRKFETNDEDHNKLLYELLDDLCKFDEYKELETKILDHNKPKPPPKPVKVVKKRNHNPVTAKKQPRQVNANNNSNKVRSKHQGKRIQVVDGGYSVIPLASLKK